MQVVSRSALVLFTPQQMFDLVNDVERYPEFLPWCESADVYHHTENQMKASLGISKGGINKSFTTHNDLVVAIVLSAPANMPPSVRNT